MGDLSALIRRSPSPADQNDGISDGICASFRNSVLCAFDEAAQTGWRLLCADCGILSRRRTLDASIARLVGTFQNMSVAVDDLQVRHAPIVQQVRPRHTPVLAPDAIERHAVIHLRVLPEATARLAATTRLKPSQQRRLFARRVPELPCDDACAMPGGTFVRAPCPTGRYATRIDRLAVRTRSRNPDHGRRHSLDTVRAGHGMSLAFRSEPCRVATSNQPAGRFASPRHARDDQREGDGRANRS